MAMGRRILFFVLTNILVVVTISIIVGILSQFLGLGSYYQRGAGGTELDLQNLFIFCLLWGFVGSFVSLLMSKFMAKWMMRVKVINPAEARGEALDLVQTVHRLSKQAGISRMPEVGIYNSPEVNAFATGPTKNRALVAVSSGLLQRMNREQMEGVLGHEVAHIANGDMVTMTLVQGIVNVFVLFFARVLAFVVSQAMSRDNERGGGSNFLLIWTFEILFGFLGMIIVAYYSRAREFRADAGGAQLAGRGKMIAALQGLQSMSGLVDERSDKSAIAAFKISGRRGGFRSLFSTHPPLEMRIERLQKAAMGL